MPDAYSTLKAFRHPDVLQAIREGRPSRLPHVELILADLCNQNCVFCSYRLDGYTSNQLFDKRRMMDGEKALEILRDAKEIGVQAIQYTGGGEPTVHPMFKQAIEETQKLGLAFAVVSNGVRINDELADLLSRASWLRISLDAGKAETYAAIRRCSIGHWEQAKAAVRKLRSAIDRDGSGCELGVGFVVTPNNWREVSQAGRLARDLGAHNFRISAQFSSQDEGLFAQFYTEAARECRMTESLGSDDFTVYNRFGERLDDLRLKNPEHAMCGYQFFTTYIGADLQVYRCCGYAYNERGWVGSLVGTRFKDFWMSQERFDNQIRFDGRGCERCQFRRINENLAYVLEPQLHDAFV